ncbi:hypothetical protein SDC9_101998 [bioreactor metagenome]|uniref:NAD-specific glutamate dehydrogenase n=1 Tax=bioreactor metagenome TaxID=1076179 RepID=A0A645APM0_9ZZZZ
MRRASTRGPIARRGCRSARPTGGASGFAARGALLTHLLEEGLAFLGRHAGHLGAHFRRQVARHARGGRGIAHRLIHAVHLVGSNDGDLCAFAQAVYAVGHHLVAGLQIAHHAHAVAIRGAHGDLALSDGVVRLHQIHVVVLHRRGGHGEHVLQQVHLQLHVDELVGEQPAVGVVESCLGLDGAGRGVDGVVQRIHAALGQQLFLVAVPQLDGQILPGGHASRQRAHVHFGQREHRVDGLDLRDGDQPRGVRWVDHVAQIRLAQAKPPGNRRGDACVAQLQLGRIHLRLVRGDRAFVLAHQRGLGVHLLVGDGVLRLQLFVTLKIKLGVLEQRLIAQQRALHLVQRGLVAARVDLGQQLAGLHLVAFLEVQLDQLARCLGTHHRRGPCVHGADGADQHPHVAPLHHASRHRLRLRAALRSTRSTRPTS